MTRLRRGGELALLEPMNQSVQRPVEHLGDVAGGDLMAQQLLRVAQLVVRALADRDLQGESLRRERGDSGSWGRCIYPR
jgi:hypothetical protein